MTRTTTDDPFRFDLIPPGSAVLCALSGGADSMYLLCRLLEGAEEGGYTVRAAHYHHGLRPTADRDEAFVRAWCAGRGVPLATERGDVSAAARSRGVGVEEAARELRYDFLRRAARDTGCTLIATGHQAQDNAETVLMNLIRGCGTLRGIPERRDDLIRPMLAVTRPQLLAWLEAHGIPHVEDETNADLCCTRNRVRHRLLPLLEQLNPRAAEHLNAAARSAGEDDACLETQARALLAEAGAPDGSVSAGALAGAPRPVALRALHLLTGGGRAHLETLLALCAAGKPSWSLDLPGGRAACSFGRLYPRVDAPPEPAALAAGETLSWGRWEIGCARALCPAKAYVGPGEFYLRPGPYTVRPRREGDGLRLGRRPYKSVKKLMIEQRLPAPLRDGVPVLDRDGTAAAVGGLGPHGDALARPGEACLHIILRQSSAAAETNDHRKKEENGHASGH